MEKINNFKKKGGVVVWIDGEGAQATYRGKPRKFLMDKFGDVYRCDATEYWNSPEGFTRIKALYA